MYNVLMCSGPLPSLTIPLVGQTLILTQGRVYSSLECGQNAETPKEGCKQTVYVYKQLQGYTVQR